MNARPMPLQGFYLRRPGGYVVASAASRRPWERAAEERSRRDEAGQHEHGPCHWTTSRPAAAIVDPTTPPMSAWLELEGRPMYHVIRFHVIAPTRPARTMLSVIASESTRPLAIVAATKPQGSYRLRHRDD